MGNALQKASPTSSKHAVLNNSQVSEATGDRSLLNTTDDASGTTMLINDPRSPTDGINRTPIQISRTKSLFRGMFSGRKPSQPELAEYAASVNAAADDASTKASEAVSVTSSSAGTPQPVVSTPLSESNGPKPEAVPEKAKDCDALLIQTDDEPVTAKVTVAEAESENEQNVTTENEEAFIVVDNKKKKKKQEKANKARAEAELRDAEDEHVDEDDDAHLEVAKPVKPASLTKVHSDSNLNASPKLTAAAEQGGDSASKRVANENEAPSSLRVKVEKACRSLTNLSAKSKAISVQNGTKSGKDGLGQDDAATTGSSAPNATTSPLADICTENVATTANQNGKYMMLVNDE